MKMSRTVKTLFVICLAAYLVAGCTSVSRQLGSITANKYADARSGTTWVVPPPQLEPPIESERTVYISYRNISDAQLDLRQRLIQSAENQGWNAVNQPDKAHYRLRVSTQFFGEVEPGSGGKSAARTMGSIAGAAGGVGVGLATAKATDSNTAGIGLGAGAGALMAQGIANASKPREWALIMDVILEERLDEEIEVEISTGTGSSAGSAAGTGNSRMASGGGKQRSNTSAATTSKTTNYFPHGIRLSVWANQMNMTQEEATPEIKKRVKKVATKMLPQ